MLEKQVDYTFSLGREYGTMWKVLLIDKQAKQEVQQT